MNAAVLNWVCFGWVSLYGDVLSFLEQHLLSCPFRKFFHLQCPGCGLQSSLLALLRGNVWRSISLYPPTIPIVGMLIFLGLHLKYRYQQGALILAGNYLLCTVLIVANYIFKIFTHQVIDS